MPEETNGRVPRLTVFPDRPDCLVVYLPEGSTLPLPPLASPFTRDGVSEACAQAGLDVRVSEGTPGKWDAAYRALRRAEASERGQRQRLREAAKNAERLGCESLAARSRAESLARKNEVDENIRVLKAELNEAKSRAFTSGQYLPVRTYRTKEKRLQVLKDESQALQTRIGELREAERRECGFLNAEHRKERRAYAEEFMKVARDLLPEAALQRIHGVLQDEQFDSPSTTPQI